jgi:CBS domain containing-hemolysin-like protein
MIPVFVLLAALVMLGFAVVETAFGVLMRLPRRLEAEREDDSGALGAYLDDPLKFFIPARFMRGTLLIVVMVLLAQLFESGPAAKWLLFFAGFGIYLLVSHILPSLLMQSSPERVLELLLPTFTAVANILSPFTALIIGWVARAEPGADAETALDATDRTASAAVTPAPQVEQSRLLRSVVDFGETLVREVMTPRPDIVAIRSEATLDDLRKLVQEQEYSRLPVYTDNLDNIVGLIVVKDLIQMTETPLGSRKASDIMRPAAFVPETKRVADLLREFQVRRFQLAIVVDEHGGTAGLVTVEDVVEELVGEIRDEYDVDAESVVRETEDTYVFSAKASIEEMAERLRIAIEDDDEFETVGGYVLKRVGRVPAVGERFTFDGLDVEILEAERRRIHKVRVTRLAPSTTESEG